MRSLVTGGAGFIGSHVADLLIEKRHDVCVIDNLSSGKKENLNEDAWFHEIDLADYFEIKELFMKEKFDVVYHLAAQIDVRKSVLNPTNDAKINILDTLNLLELCREFKIKHFIFSSSGGAIYGDDVGIPTPEESIEKPISPYGCAKLAIEKYLNFYNRAYGLKFTSLRYSNVYGPRQNFGGEAGVVAIFINKMLNNENPTIFWGEQTRDFVYVEDVARANLLALNDTKSEIYNIGTGIETNIIELFHKINRFFGGGFNAVYMEKKAGEQARSCLNYGKIRKRLGWEPRTNLNKGLKKTHTWFLNNITNKK